MKKQCKEAAMITVGRKQTRCFPSFAWFYVSRLESFYARG